MGGGGQKWTTTIPSFIGTSHSQHVCRIHYTIGIWNLHSWRLSSILLMNFSSKDDGRGGIPPSGDSISSYLGCVFSLWLVQQMGGLIWFGHYAAISRRFFVHLCHDELFPVSSLEKFSSVMTLSFPWLVWVSLPPDNSFGWGDPLRCLVFHERSCFLS